jgi:hypothetical protein
MEMGIHGAVLGRHTAGPAYRYIKALQHDSLQIQAVQYVCLVWLSADQQHRQVQQ